MHCVMLNIQSLCGWWHVRSSPGGQGCEQPRGWDKRLSGMWGTERPEGYHYGCFRSWSSWIPWEQTQRTSFLCIPFNFWAFNTSTWGWLWRKKDRGFSLLLSFLELSSPFGQSSLSSKQRWVESLFLPAMGTWLSTSLCWSLLAPRTCRFSEAAISPLNLCFPSLSRRVHRPEAYSVAETCFNPASFTTQNKLCIYIYI